MKAALLELADKLQYISVYRHWNCPPPRGILLTGPPGTGKTWSVKCLANEVNVYLIEIRYEDVASRYVDQPIEYLRAIKKEVDEATRNGERAIIFLDEGEQFMPSRDGFAVQQGDVKKTNFFLTWMDGGLDSNPNLIFIVATNHEEGIDPAARRAGRLEERLEFGVMGFDGLQEVAKIHIGISEKDAGRRLFDEIDWEILREDCSDLSGADVARVVQRAKGEKAKLHKEVLLRRMETFEENRHFSDRNAVMQLILEQEPDLSPPLISGEDLRRAMMDVIEERKAKEDQQTVVRGFGG